MNPSSLTAVWETLGTSLASHPGTVSLLAAALVVWPLGALGVRLSRQPARRATWVLATSAAALLAPCLALVPWPTAWSIATARPAGHVSTVAQAAAPSPSDNLLPQRGDLRPGSLMVSAAGTPDYHPQPQSSTLTLSVTDSDPIDPAAAERPSSASATASEVGWPRVLDRLWRLVGWLYLAGLVTTLGAWIGGYLLLGRVIRRSTAAPDSLAKLWRVVSGEAGTRVRLRISEEVAQPLVAGLWRPTLLMPAAWSSQPPSRLTEAALAHEWSHLAQGDLGAWYLANWARAVFCFQPLAWWLVRRLRLDQDLVADGRAARLFASPEDYAECLVELARGSGSRSPQAALAFGSSGTSLRRRIEQLVSASGSLELACPARWRWAVTGLMLAAASGAGVFRLRAADVPNLIVVVPAESEPGQAGTVVTQTLRLDQTTQPVTITTQTPATPSPSRPSVAGKPTPAPPATPVVSRLNLKLVRDDSVAERPAHDSAAPVGDLNYGGVVMDQGRKKPVVGATVTVRLYSAPEPGQRENIVSETKYTTDERGRYLFTIPAQLAADPRLYLELDVTHPDHPAQTQFGYSLAMIRKNLEQGEIPFFKLIWMRPGAEIHGRVTDEQGVPIPGVRLAGYSRRLVNGTLASGSEYGHWLTGTTDAEGRYRLVADATGGVFLRFYSPEHAPLRVVWVDGRRGELDDIRLVPGQEVTGQVLDARGNPLRNQWVALTGERESEDGSPRLDEAEQKRRFLATLHHALERVTRTDGQGRFRFDPVAAGRWTLSVDSTCRDRLRADRDDVMPLPAAYVDQALTWSVGETPAPVEVRPVPGQTLTLRWVDSQGAPTRGWDFFVAGKLAGRSWMADHQRSPDGVERLTVPHGLEGTVLYLSCNEHSALRVRLEEGAALSNSLDVQLGKVDRDWPGIEIVRYTAPIVRIRPVADDGTRLTRVRIEGWYHKGRGQHEETTVDGLEPPGPDWIGGPSFSRQLNGEFRSECLLPDEELLIRVSAEGGYQGELKLQLPEGEERAMELKLRRSAQTP